MERMRDEMALFFTKFSVMLSNGVPLVRSLAILAEETEDEALSAAIRSTKEKVIDGARFTEAMKQSTDLFDEKIITLLHAGEVTGCLDLTTKIIPEYILFAGLKDWKK